MVASICMSRREVQYVCNKHVRHTSPRDVEDGGDADECKEELLVMIIVERSR